MYRKVILNINRDAGGQWFCFQYQFKHYYILMYRYIGKKEITVCGTAVNQTLLHIDISIYQQKTNSVCGTVVLSSSSVI